MAAWIQATARPAAVAPAARYQPGHYRGGIALDPASGESGTLAFTVRGRRITGLTIREPGMICVGGGGSGVATTIDFTLHMATPLAISPSGAFSFRGTLAHGKQLKLSGTVSGAAASGTISLGAGGPGGTSCLTSEPLRFHARTR